MNNHPTTISSDQLPVPTEFNGPNLFDSLWKLLEGETQSSHVDVGSICSQLTKNWKLLLNFNYTSTKSNSSGKDHLDNNTGYTEVNSLMYILRTLLCIMEHTNSDHITKEEGFSQLIDVLPKLLSPSSTINVNFNDIFISDRKFSYNIFLQLLQLIKDSKRLIKYLTEKTTSNETNESDHSGNRSDEILLHVIIQLASHAAQHAKFIDKELANYEVIFKLFLCFIDLYFKKNKYLLKLPDIYFYSNVQHNIILNYLNLVWALVDQTKLVLTFIDNGYVKAILQWISIDDLKYEYHLAILCIIHNIARDQRGKCHLVQQ